MINYKAIYILLLPIMILVFVFSLRSALAETQLSDEDQLENIVEFRSESMRAEYLEIASETTYSSLANTSVITPGVLMFHEADSNIAYNWFSFIPNTVSKDERSYILITGLRAEQSDDYGEITDVARDEATRRIPIAENYKYIMLTPAIPRPLTNHVYAVAFDWKVFLSTTDPFVQRPDFKVNLMIDQLIDDLRNAGYNVDDKVFIEGFSAAAMFAQRYALLHPERVHAIAAGQCGGAMTFPESNYTNAIVTQMEWPVGVSDFSSLVGEDFNEVAYREVPQFIYIGDEDDTNSTLWGTGELWRTQAQIDFLKAEFGDTDPVRMENQAAYMASLDYDVTFKIYPGIGHQETSQMKEDTFDFFRKARYQNRLYLPFVAYRSPTSLLPIVVDGDGEEWLEYDPVASDPQGDTLGGPRTDMKAIFIETDQHYVYLMVEAYDPPLLIENAIMELDLLLVDNNDTVQKLHFNIRSNGNFWTGVDQDGDGDWEDYPITGALFAWGDVMELRLPLHQLGNPELVHEPFLNFGTSVNGEWTTMDLVEP